MERNGQQGQATAPPPGALDPGDLRRVGPLWREAGGADGLVLLYHRIAAPGNDPFGLRVAPERFEAHLSVLRDVAAPLPLAELATRARAGTLPDRAVAVTFDDGSPDTLEVALPGLRRHAIPATVFVTAAAGATREYWWEELASLLLRPGTLPASLELDGRSWDLARDRTYDRAAAGRDRHWRAFSGEPPTLRHRAFEEIWTLLRPLDPRRRERQMARLREWAAAPERRREPRARPLADPEIRHLAASPLVEIGAHTVTHPLLPALRPRAQEREIRESRLRLEGILGRPVADFAYPYGGPDSHGPDTASLVRAAGYRLACSTRAARVSASADPLEIPRLNVGDWDRDDFARWLSVWSG